MDKFQSYLSPNEKLFSKKNLIAYLILAILVVAIPLGVNLIKKQTELRVKAAGGDIKFPTTETQQCSGDNCTTTSQTVKLEIKAPDF